MPTDKVDRDMDKEERDLDLDLLGEEELEPMNSGEDVDEP